MNFGYKNFIFAVISAVKMDFNLLKYVMETIVIFTPKLYTWLYIFNLAEIWSINKTLLTKSLMCACVFTLFLFYSINDVDQ